MEALCFGPMEEDLARSEGRELQDEGKEAGSSHDEEEEEEPEPPPVVRRKVSFADAFGLDLVSVKEFDEAEVEVEAEAEAEGGPTPAPRAPERLHMSCLFSLPWSPEELEQRLDAQMVELESVELLPGSRTLRGVVRVVNLCYAKEVFTRLSLDRWATCFELPAQYLPGSSDMKTDRFCFHYTLLPPFQRDGSRLEFCLRYQTAAGTFWANNQGMNYVVLCQEKAQATEEQQQEEKKEEEEEERRGGRKGNRSCLKAKRKGSAEARESILMAALAAEAARPHKAEEAERNSEIHSLLKREELKPLVVNAKTRQRAARLARVQDHFYQKTGKASKREVAAAAAAAAAAALQPPRGISAGAPRQLHRKQPQQLLTYHQIPLYTLDWSSHKSQSNMDDLWGDSTRLTFSKALEAQIIDASSANVAVWKSSLNDEGGLPQEMSVCEVWRAFLDGPSFPDHSSVPESEWLQTAASVSPSVDKGPQRAAPEAPPARSWECREASLASVALSGEGGQRAEAGSGTPQEEEAAMRGTSQRSQTNSGNDSQQEFGGTPASDVPASAACQEKDEGQGGDEGSVSDTGASSEDLRKPGADVLIPEESSLEERLWEEEVTSANNGTQQKNSGTGDGEEDRIATESTESQTQGGEEIFRPRKPEESQISPRSADEKQRVESGPNQNSGNRLKPIERDNNKIKAGVNPKQTWEEDSTESQGMSGDFTAHRAGKQAADDKYVDLGLEEADTNEKKEGATQEVDKEAKEEVRTASEENGKGEENRSYLGITPEHQEPCAEINPSVEVELLWTHSKEAWGGNVAMETGRNDNTPAAASVSRKGESGAIGAPGELWKGEAQDQSAPCGRPENFTPGKQEAVIVESAPAFQATGVASDRALVENFGKDLVQAVWEEVFAQSADAHRGGEGPPPKRDWESGGVFRHSSNPVEECAAAGGAELPEHPAAGPTRSGSRDEPRPEPLRRRSAPKDPGSDEGAAAEPAGLTLWRLLHLLSQLTRLALGGALVGGVCAVCLLYDLPAIFALYAFTLCWWLYTWRRHRRAAKAGMERC